MVAIQLNKDGVCSTQTEKYLWTSETFSQLFIYTRDQLEYTAPHY